MDYYEKKRQMEDGEKERVRQACANSKLDGEAWNMAVAKLGEKYSCHVCGVKPARPARHTFIFYAGRFDSYGDPVCVIIGEGFDWILPGDLIRCKECKNWFCTDHAYSMTRNKNDGDVNPGYCEKHVR